MAYKIRERIEGLAPALQRLEAVGKQMGRRILRKAIDQAGTLVLKSARQKAPVETGLLRKSLGKRVKVYAQSGVVVAIVGPRSGFKREVVTLDGRGALAGSKAGKRLAAAGGRTEVRNPVKYAHLLELGRAGAPAYPFLRPALEQNRAAIVDLMARVIESELAKVVRQAT